MSRTCLIIGILSSVKGCESLSLIIQSTKSFINLPLLLHVVEITVQKRVQKQQLMKKYFSTLKYMWKEF